MGEQNLTAISLYSGAGGLDAGFIKAGFDVLWANDADSWACDSYRQNVGDHIVCGDVLKQAPPKHLKPTLVIGGPPCQGFSVIGKMDESDPRSRHVFHLLKVADAVEAHGFVLENVKALAASPRWTPIRDELIKRAEALGFTTKLVLLNAADYGVPQTRERMFLIGIRDGFPVEPEPTTHLKRPTVREALEQLPCFGEVGNNSTVTARVVPAAKPIMRPTAFRGSLLFNGSGRPLHLDMPAKTLPASMGGNATPIIDQDELDRGVDPWVVDYHQRLLDGGKPLRRAPSRLRRLTVEEAAALQDGRIAKGDPPLHRDVTTHAGSPKPSAPPRISLMSRMRTRAGSQSSKGRLMPFSPRKMRRLPPRLRLRPVVARIGSSCAGGGSNGRS